MRCIIRILVASDIHGSLAWTKKLIKKFNDKKLDKIILLGDLYYHGPRNILPEEYNPKLVCEEFNKLANKIICIKGNCDAEVDEMISNFKFRKNYYFKVGNTRFFCTHGHKYNMDNLPKKDFDIMLYGHTHINNITRQGNKIFINPGSTSLPKQNTKNSYAILDENKITIFDFDDNIISEHKF